MNYFRVGFSRQEMAWPSSRGSSQPKDRTCILCVSCVGRQVLYHWYHQCDFVIHNENNHHRLPWPACLLSVGLLVCCWLLRGSSSLPAPSARSHSPSSLEGHLPPPKLSFQVMPVPHGPACIYQEAFQTPTGAKGIFLTLCPQHFLFRCSRDLQG